MKIGILVGQPLGSYGIFYVLKWSPVTFRIFKRHFVKVDDPFIGLCDWAGRNLLGGNIWSDNACIRNIFFDPGGSSVLLDLKALPCGLSSDKSN